ncbi:MAG: phosphopantetheine-binding protein [Candidatus Thiodiazotropha sp.]
MNKVLKQFIFNEVVHITDESSFSDDDDLLDAGLDSMGIMRLVLFIEEKFGITLPDEEIEPENIQTINKIVAWIERHR